MSEINTVIFDLGGVLIDWNPHYVFTDEYFDSPDKKAFFFSHVCTSDWNEKQDEGRSIVEATEELIREFPDWEQPIRDYYGRWTEMLRGPIPGTVELFRRLKEQGRHRLYALTNWQADLFNIALVRYDFLHWFHGRVVSGEEKTRKPFPGFYNILLSRYQVQPGEALFIDDNLRNVKAAEALGIRSVHFTDPAGLEEALRQHQLL